MSPDGERPRASPRGAGVVAGDVAKLRCFAVCALGLEELVAGELRSLGIDARVADEEPGGVAFDATVEALYQANLHLRTASRVLVRLASAFDLTLAGLLLRAEGAGERLSRAAGQPVWRDPETGYVRRQLFSRPDHPVELVRVELPARQRVALPASSYAHIRQLVWVQSGSLVITEGSERHALAAGDCLGFGLPAETTFANETNATCTYVVALARS